jgi:hypothetical protein
MIILILALTPHYPLFISMLVSRTRTRSRAVNPRAAKRSGASLSPFPPARRATTTTRTPDPSPLIFFNPRPQTPNPKPHTNIRAGPIRVLRFIRG